MLKKSTQSPSGPSFFPPNDQATYRDLNLFEERLKTNALILNRRKSRYQCMSCLPPIVPNLHIISCPVFLVQLIFAIVFLLCESPSAYIVPLDPLPVPASPRISKTHMGQMLKCALLIHTSHLDSLFVIS